MTRKAKMNEDKAKEICCSPDLDKYTHAECVDADIWVKGFALAKLEKYLKGNANGIVREYVMDMARATYGSIETDSLLTATRCYPDWLQQTMEKDRP